MYKEEALWEMNNASLRQICINFGILGMSKARKEDLVNAILDYEENNKRKRAKKVVQPKEGKIESIAFDVESVLENENDNKYESLITVASGAATGMFSVVGYSVAQVAGTLREVLNIDQLANGLVNEKEVSEDYIIKKGDRIEFVKMSGIKGN